MIDPNRLCMGCMRESENLDTACPNCGFSLEKYKKERSSRVLPAGTILAGKYLLGKVLGEGGFGITYLAWDLNEEEKIAIKEYFPAELAYRDTVLTQQERVSASGGEKRAYYEKGLESFAKEAKNLQKFNWVSGIVSIRDFFHENNTAYIVMEFVEGKTLSQVLKENGGPLPWKQVLDIMRPVLEALAVVHEYQIIHRDISPENIIVSADRKKVTLIDFGAARLQTGNETKSMTITLKHGYAPIEQYQSRGKQGPWTDVYAVCATMYHLIGGKRPASATERMESPLTPLAHLNLQIPQWLSNVISRGMEIEGARRYQKVQELKEALYNPSQSSDNRNKNITQKTSAASRPPERKKTAWIVPTIFLEVLGILILYLIFWSPYGLKSFSDEKGNRYKGHTYQVVDENMSWEEAKKACEDAGGHLVIIETAEEAAFIEGLVEKGTKVFYWLGGTDKGYDENDYHWINGEPLTYNNWAKGQPDNGFIDGEYENYIGMVRIKTPYMSREYTWNDYRNGTADDHGYICEWD